MLSLKRNFIEFVQDRVNIEVGLGYPPMFIKEDKGEISKIFYTNISSFKMSDFFANTQLQYTRNWDKKQLTFNPDRVIDYV